MCRALPGFVLGSETKRRSKDTSCHFNWNCSPARIPVWIDTRNAGTRWGQFVLLRTVNNLGSSLALRNRVRSLCSGLALTSAAGLAVST